MNPGTVSFVKRLPNFCVRSAEKVEFSNPTSIIPTLTFEPVSAVFELLCGLFLLYDRVVSFHVNPGAAVVTVGLFVTGAGVVGCVAGVVGVLGVVGVAADVAVAYTHLRAHETSLHVVCRLLLEKKTNTA